MGNTTSSVSFEFYLVHCMFMDCAPICSLHGINLGPNGWMVLCAASSSLSNLKELE